ncbi:hypothetical protein, partial [Oscillibacter sp.]|uniref:hypothetical protein n=1 Tax=Oscillibacter sp. TaxID=1945593 RepID=UPI0028A25F08
NGVSQLHSIKDCKPCLFLFLFQFAQFIVPYLAHWPRGRAGILTYVKGKAKGPPLSERTPYLKPCCTLKNSKALYSIIAAPPDEST